MPINLPIIDAGPTAKPTSVGGMLVLDLAITIPPKPSHRLEPDDSISYYYRNTLTSMPDGGVPEGTIALYYQGTNELVKVYVVANVGGGRLEWRPVKVRQTWIDVRTGRPWDPYYDSRMQRR